MYKSQRGPKSRASRPDLFYDVPACSLQLHLLLRCNGNLNQGYSCDQHKEDNSLCLCKTVVRGRTVTGCIQDLHRQHSGTEVTVCQRYVLIQQHEAFGQCQEKYDSNPNVEIDIQITPYKGGEYWTKLEASAGGGTAPDVFWLNVLHIDSYADGGILADMTDAVAASDIKDNFPESLVNSFVRDGKNYATPKDFDTNALWYNKDLFDQAGVAYPTDDMSYEDLVALATELKDKLPDGIYPFACPVDFQTWYYQTVYANGGWILNDDKTETGYADPKTQEGIQCWIDMIDAGLSPNASTLAETGSDAMFEAGQIAMTLAGYQRSRFPG